MTKEHSLGRLLFVLVFVLATVGSVVRPVFAAGVQLEAVPGTVLSLSSAVLEKMQYAITKWQHRDYDAVMVAIDGMLRTAPVSGVIFRFRDGMFPETVSANMLKLAAVVRQGDCVAARPLFDEVTQEFERGSGKLSGLEFGSNGLQSLRRRCPP